MIDSHCHLDHEPLVQNIEGILAKCKQEGVKKVLTISTTLNGFPKILEIIDKDEMIFGTFGIHPHETNNDQVSKDEIIKKINTNIKTIHYVAPQVWIWRKNRVKKIKKFIDHILLLFDFEKKYFDEENIKNTFVGHPLIENNEDNKKIIENIIPKDKKIISIFPGSRKSETDVLLNILIDFIKLMNKRHNDFYFYFHATDENKNLILSEIKKFNIENVDVVSDESIKSKILSNSVFAVSKSGTVSLQISSSNIPSIIIYKLSFINFMIFKMLVNVKFANIINIINNREVIPELLQNECNADEIYRSVIYLLKNPELIKKQLSDCSKTLEGIRSKTSSSEEACLVLRNYLS